MEPISLLPLMELSPMENEWFMMQCVIPMLPGDVDNSTPYRVGARDVDKVGPACKGYPAWKLRGDPDPDEVIPADKDLSLLTGKAYYDEFERKQVLVAQYEAACNGGKRSRKPRSMHNAQRLDKEQHLQAKPKAKPKAKAKRKRSSSAMEPAFPALKSALVQPGAKRRKGAMVVRFVDARDLTAVGGFTIMAAAEAMCGMSLQ